MTLPRPIHPGTTYLVSRRCVQRQFLLRPNDEVNRIIEFCLAYEIARHGLVVHAFVVMSDHYHLVVYDPYGVLPKFLQELNSLTARMLNRAHARDENLWSTDQVNFNQLVELSDVMAKVEYTLVNPVRAQLVERAADWPGLTSMSLLDGSSKTISRPLSVGKRSKLPASVCLKLDAPPAFPGTFAAWSKLVRARVARFERKAARRRRQQGECVRGAQAVLSDSPFRVPSQPKPSTRSIRPFVAAKCRRARSAALAALREFRERYRRARDAFRSRQWTTVFPAGTYAMARTCGVIVAPARTAPVRFA